MPSVTKLESICTKKSHRRGEVNEFLVKIWYTLSNWRWKMSDMPFMTTTNPCSSFENMANMYASLNAEKQKEVYDFICFLVSQNAEVKKNVSPVDSYSKGFFDLFGSCTDDLFEEPKDCVAELREDELF